MAIATVAELMFEAAFGAGAFNSPEDFNGDDVNEARLRAAFMKLSEREQAEFLGSSIAKHLAWRKSNVKATAGRKMLVKAKGDHKLLVSLVKDGHTDMALHLYGRPSVNQELLKQGKAPLPEAGK